MLDISVLYRDHWEAIYTFLRSRLRGADDAEIEDLTAIVFERVVAHAARYEDRGHPPSSWLFQISANLLKDTYRYRVSHPTVTSDDAVEIHAKSVADAGSDQQADAILIAQALMKLPARQRLVIVERYLMDASIRDTALVLDMSQNSVKHVARRALKNLKAIIREVA
jgi:RNA polymerase sigma-70 factor, ECF subfamily